MLLERDYNSSSTQWLTAKQLCAMMAISKSSLYRLIKTADFPQPFAMRGITGQRWLAADVRRYMEGVQNATH